MIFLHRETTVYSFYTLNISYYNATPPCDHLAVRATCFIPRAEGCPIYPIRSVTSRQTDDGSLRIATTRHRFFSSRHVDDRVSSKKKNASSVFFLVHFFCLLICVVCGSSQPVAIRHELSHLLSTRYGRSGVLDMYGGDAHAFPHKDAPLFRPTTTFLSWPQLF